MQNPLGFSSVFFSPSSAEILPELFTFTLVLCSFNIIRLHMFSVCLAWFSVFWWFVVTNFANNFVAFTSNMLLLPFLFSGNVFQSVSETLPSLFHSPVAPVKTFFLPTTEISVIVHFVLGPCRSTFLVVLKSRMETDLFYGTRFTVCFNGPVVLGCPPVLGVPPGFCSFHPSLLYIKWEGRP